MRITFFVRRWVYGRPQTRRPMRMRVRANRISFGDTPPSRRGWSQQELRQIDRMRAVGGNEVQVELVLGESDEGGPWCIVCDHERVVLHIARIDRSYVIASLCRSRLQRATSITDATELALRRLNRELQEHLHA